MIRSTIISQGRKLANDTDATSPFHSDADCYGLLDNWQIELALLIGYPRNVQALAFADGEGGAASTKTLQANTLAILAVFLEDSVAGKYSRLKPRTELEMAEADPSWRVALAGAPSYYVLGDTVTEAAAETMTRTITTERAVDAAKTMRIHSILKPATGTDGTKSPVMPVEFHVTAPVYLAWWMYMPRNMAKAAEYEKLFYAMVRRISSRSSEHKDESVAVWDRVWTGGNDFTPNRLSV